ncbi:hypothetical protein CsSME_00005977 [Camellia sinensis var. sinensis]
MERERERKGRGNLNIHQERNPSPSNRRSLPSPNQSHRRREHTVPDRNLAPLNQSPFRTLELCSRSKSSPSLLLSDLQLSMFPIRSQTVCILILKKIHAA